MKRPFSMLFGLILMAGGLTTVMLLIGSADPTQTESRSDAADPARPVAMIYRSPTCSCCHEYEAYLSGQGFEVRATEVTDTAALKREHGVPSELWSCHTGVIGGYVVEGHVPVEAIEQLLEQRPVVDGIALPGMPAGSPGMGGAKTAPFEIVSFDGDAVAPFVTL